jgi:phage tail P2-like protein
MTTEPRAHLLPPSSTPLERAAVQALAAAHDYPTPLRDLWNAATCPSEALPFLAWARSVDWWNEAWPEATKRAVVEAAFEVHRKKGTLGALRRVVAPFGYTLTVREWWQTEPPGHRGTFDLEIHLEGRPLAPSDSAEIERLIDETRPLTRHPATIGFRTETRGATASAALTLTGETITVLPFAPPLATTAGGPYAIAAIHADESVDIHPLH